MKNFFSLLLCLSLCGCTSIARMQSAERKNAEKIRVLEIEAQQLREGLVQKENELAALKTALEQNEQSIKEKQDKIEELRKKLEGLGVFEK